ncbi:MAG: polyprenyl synthetase family protein [Planctomycetes bacterium]|nr:polyprenyl synthetase family protein [Planctomycetota bacterium]
MRGGRGDDLGAYLVFAKRLVDRELDRRLPGLGEPPRALHRAMRYAVFPGGKRLRPALALLACETFGGKSSDALPAAAALEMIHTYSLIHDDLPCMDDDDFRRGRPTVHRAFGEAMAVLAGDALHTAAFRAIAATRRREAIPALLESLSRAAGSAGMVGGQVDDLDAEGKRPALGRVRSIHARKTAALLAASAECGAICAGAGEARVNEAAEFGKTLGLAFQIADDVLDVVGTRRRLGKTPGKDARSKKMTYPACVGLDRSRARARALAARAERRARTLPARRRDLLVALARFAHERTS